MSKVYRSILVDDEESARNILSNLLLNFCPQIEVIKLCEDLEQAVVAIKKHKHDLVFLDIEIPNYAGYEITSFFDQIDFDIIDVFLWLTLQVTSTYIKIRCHKLLHVV